MSYLFPCKALLDLEVLGHSTYGERQTFGPLPCLRTLEAQFCPYQNRDLQPKFLYRLQ
jgi:hypothetical protein